MPFSPFWPAVFWRLFLHPDLKSFTENGISRTSLSSSVCLLEMNLAIPIVCFSINTRVQYLQDSMVLSVDSMVCCSSAFAQLGANPSKALGCCWRGSSWQRQWQSLTERGEQDPASPTRTWYLLSDVYVYVAEVLLLLKAGCPSLSSNVGP